MNFEKSTTGGPAETRIRAAFEKAGRELLARRTPDGHWTGRLSASALSTATAVSALSLFRNSSRASGRHSAFAPAEQERIDALIRQAVAWLVRHQNEDGGWGDTDKSFSNVSTTLLVKSALVLSDTDSSEPEGLPGHDSVVAGGNMSVLDRADAYLHRQGGVDAVRRRYGKDMTFSVPILTNAALAGLVPWTDVPQLPFERAAAPRCLFRLLNLQVVSYAIPALVAIGQVRFHYVPQPGNPLSLLRRRARTPTLRLIETMQPESGGYLEAAPLTAFVAMSLIACGHADHPVVVRGLRFLMDTVREDGSWPIDTNLATWATTLSINALGHEVLSQEPPTSVRGLTAWLLSCQHRKTHPFTGAKPGGWGWTDLSGAVPDGDDTPGALLALAELRPLIDDEKKKQVRQAAENGLAWLVKLRNRDGGMPTFCRGWGLLPFDRSSTDLTAHVIRAFTAWPTHAWRLKRKRMTAMAGMFEFLERNQNADGSWYPLWFGNQHQPDDVNPFYGTARVLRALLEPECLKIIHEGFFDIETVSKGIDWIVKNQNADGGWGGDGKNSSVEETAVTVEALALLPTERKDFLNVYHRGLEWLLDAVETDRWTESSPIGLYFAKLWYYEELYPIVFTASALRTALKHYTHETSRDL